jgi:hypothetical protein
VVCSPHGRRHACIDDAGDRTHTGRQPADRGQAGRTCTDGLVDDWLPLARGEMKCVDGLIGLLKRLPLDVQVVRGIGSVTDLCIQSDRVTVAASWLMNNWLKETRNTAEELGRLGEWQMLVDSLVVAGNEGLAPYSR